jgi:MFS family permease
VNPARALVDVRPLRSSPAFRRLWASGALSGVGSLLTTVAVLYQTWQLTHSSVAVGAVSLAKAVPSVILGLAGGSLADSHDRRRLVLITTTGQLVCAALLAFQALAGLMSLAALLALVAAQSGLGALGAPARRTFPVHLLAGEQLGAGIALNRLSFQGAMLVGPAIAGAVLAAWGAGGCYAVDALSFAAASYAVLRLPRIERASEGGRPGVRAIWDGWRFIAGNGVLTGAFLTDVLATVMAMPVSMFPVIDSERFGGSPQTLGLFFSALALGGIVAGASSGLITRSSRPGAVMLGCGVMWGVTLAGFGLAHQLWLAVVCLAVAGGADMWSVSSRSLIVQVATPDSHRGRVGAVDHVVGVSGPDVGNFRGGLVAAGFSPEIAVVSGGLLCLLGIGATAVVNKPLRRFRAPTAQDEEVALSSS